MYVQFLWYNMQVLYTIAPQHLSRKLLQHSTMNSFVSVTTPIGSISSTNSTKESLKSLIARQAPTNDNCSIIWTTNTDLSFTLTSSDCSKLGEAGTSNDLALRLGKMERLCPKDSLRVQRSDPFALHLHLGERRFHPSYLRAF